MSSPPASRSSPTGSASTQRSLYLRPVGLFRAPTGAMAELTGAFRLAGGWLDFAAVEGIERGAGEVVERRVCGLGDLFERDWARNVFVASQTFEALCVDRPRLAGLALDRPRIMGIVNVTPDSFSDGGAHATTQAAVDHALRLVEEGADILDIGGESTRPGAVTVPEADEIARVVPVIEHLAGRTEARISIDTRKAAVMRAAAKVGADIINDVAALTFEPAAMDAAAESGLPIILMHAQGDPRTMQAAPTYDNALLDVFDMLEARIAACEASGIPRARLIADPGIGFGKTLAHNLELMAGLALFHGLGVPLLVGASRKSFIGKLTGVATAADRVNGSVAAALSAVSQGAQIVRVHDVAATREALSVWMACQEGSAGPAGS